MKIKITPALFLIVFFVLGCQTRYGYLSKVRVAKKEPNLKKQEALQDAPGAPEEAIGNKNLQEPKPWGEVFASAEKFQDLVQQKFILVLPNVVKDTATKEQDQYAPIIKNKKDLVKAPAKKPNLNLYLGLSILFLLIGLFVIPQVPGLGILLALAGIVSIIILLRKKETEKDPEIFNKRKAAREQALKAPKENNDYAGQKYRTNLSWIFLTLSILGIIGLLLSFFMSIDVMIILAFLLFAAPATMMVGSVGNKKRDKSTDGLEHILAIIFGAIGTVLLLFTALVLSAYAGTILVFLIGIGLAFLSLLIGLGLAKINVKGRY